MRFMENATRSDSVRPWVYWLLAAAGLGIVALEVSRWHCINQLRTESAALRTQVGDLEAAHALNVELEDVRQNLLRSHESQSIEILALRNEVTQLRTRTNEAASLRVKLHNTVFRAQHLEGENHRLRFELEAKPAPPRLGAWVGVSLRDVEAGRLNLPPPSGAQIMQILPYGPAAKSNLQIHDCIVAVDGEVISNASDFTRILSQKPVGQMLTFGVIRKDEFVSVAVKPSQWPQ
jgi:predicted metalloprotease with PDZ domain